MTDQTSICNIALQEVGAGRITSINDDSERARQCKTLYDECKLAELEANYWNFAIKRASIAADATSPAWGFDVRYSLPTSFLTLFQVENDPEHSIENGFILTDEGSPLRISYVSSDVTEGEFSKLFAMALSMRIAKSLVEGTNQKGSLIDRIEGKYMDAIRRAMNTDAIQQYPLDLEESVWLTERE